MENSKSKNQFERNSGSTGEAHNVIREDSGSTEQTLSPNTTHRELLITKKYSLNESNVDESRDFQAPMDISANFIKQMNNDSYYSQPEGYKNKKSLD